MYTNSGRAMARKKTLLYPSPSHSQRPARGRGSRGLQTQNPRSLSCGLLSHGLTFVQTGSTWRFKCTNLRGVFLFLRWPIFQGLQKIEASQASVLRGPAPVFFREVEGLVLRRHGNHMPTFSLPQGDSDKFVKGTGLRRLPLGMRF